MPPQVTPSTRRGVIDFGALVKEGLRVQQLEHEQLASAAVLSETGAHSGHPDENVMNVNQTNLHECLSNPVFD